ncbi:MAG: hypothetical protein F4180_04420 [Chloroflexi bacterium]|nr:hypothetical protein [Chloroflexota bacterium]
MSTTIKALAFTALLLTALAIGCGSSDGNGGDSSTSSEPETDARIFDRETTLSGDDLVALGMKSGKTYDVSTLPGGVEARLLYWRVNNIAVEYEARFYETHQDAVTQGTAPAEEGSGEDAVIDEDEAVYKEGIRDRRKVFKYPNSVLKPKYGAFGIYGNMVVLSEGREDGEGGDSWSALSVALEDR